MRTIYRLFSLALLACFAASAQETVHTSTITVSAGGNVDSYNYFGENGGPSFSGTYEFRLWKYLALEAGVNTILPSQQSYQRIYQILGGQDLRSYFNKSNCSGCVLIPVKSRTTTTLLPFGLRGILPVGSGRTELFAGFGGAYAFNAGASNYNAMLGQASLGGRFALDHQRRYWLGTTLRAYSNLGYGHQTWVSWTADFGFRFGH